MSMLHARVLDRGLFVLTDEADRLDLCTAKPGDLAEATGALSCGSASGLQVGEPQNGARAGRRVTVPAIPVLRITAGGTITHWALTGGARLLAAGPLDAPRAVATGDRLPLEAFDIALTGASGD